MRYIGTIQYVLESDSVYTVLRHELFNSSICISDEFYVTYDT
jgi:hypothetical protein